MYSAYDLVWGNYFYTGRNSKSKSECAKSVFDMLNNSGELVDSEADKIIDKIEYLETMMQVRIDKHEKMMED